MRRDLVVGRWGARFMGRRLVCAIGRGGIRTTKREGDGATPAGVFALRALFWRADRGPRPRTRLPAAMIGPRMGWSDDPADPRYNRLVTLGRGFGAERLRRADRLYDLAVVTSHNEAGAPGLGSAVFVHLWRGPRKPTAGCVAFAPRDLRWILARWQPGGRLVIQP